MFKIGISIILVVSLLFPIEHAPMDVVSIPTGKTVIANGVEVPQFNTYTTPSVDNMFNSGNFDKIKDSITTAQLVNDMYQTGKLIMIC